MDDNRECVRNVIRKLAAFDTNDMDSRIGLDYIVENSDYVSKLAAALDTNNEIVKKQVFELLSALCAYSRSGYNRAIETLENFKVSFKFIFSDFFLNLIFGNFNGKKYFEFLRYQKNHSFNPLSNFFDFII